MGFILYYKENISGKFKYAKRDIADYLSRKENNNDNF